MNPLSGVHATHARTLSFDLNFVPDDGPEFLREDSLLEGDASEDLTPPPLEPPQAAKALRAVDVQLTTCCARIFGPSCQCCRPRSRTCLTIRKWIILVLACFALFGNYFGYDNPSALNTQMRGYLEIDYDTWQYQYNMLYSVPICFRCLFVDSFEI